MTNPTLDPALFVCVRELARLQHFTTTDLETLERMVTGLLSGLHAVAQSPVVALDHFGAHAFVAELERLAESLEDD
jgi:hypothetical protein